MACAPRVWPAHRGSGLRTAGLACAPRVCLRTADLVVARRGYARAVLGSLRDRDLARDSAHDSARDPRWVLAALCLLHLLLALPGAGSRGIIAEEIQPYLHAYPVVVDDDREGNLGLWPPYDAATLETSRSHAPAPGWVGTEQWPQIAYQGRDRIYPLFVRGHQTTLGSSVGLLLAPLLGDGVAVAAMEACLPTQSLLALVWGLARRCGLSWPWAALACAGCLLSPGLWFFTRTGYGFELGSRVFMLVALWLAARRDQPLDWRRATGIGLALAAAVLARATIVVTVAPALIILLVHPLRWPAPQVARTTAWARFVWAGALGATLTVAFVALALGVLPFSATIAPAADLPLTELDTRTAVAPMTALVQLAWVADPRMLLAPLAAGELELGLSIPAALIGATVAGAAGARWWRGEAGDGERMFVCGLLGNALFGAWLYGKPWQFQLGMALEPLFVLAVVEQLRAVHRARPRLGQALAAAALLARLATLISLVWAEAHTANPMLSGAAQRAVLTEVEARDPSGDTLVTTTYNHVGVFEAWTGETMRPLHAWPALRSELGDAHLDGVWGELLDRTPMCAVLWTTGANVFEGPMPDQPGLRASLQRALAKRGRTVAQRRSFASEAGVEAYELWWLSGCPDPEAL